MFPQNVSGNPSCCVRLSVGCLFISANPLTPWVSHQNCGHYSLLGFFPLSLGITFFDSEDRQHLKCEEITTAWNWQWMVSYMLCAVARHGHNDEMTESSTSYRWQRKFVRISWKGRDTTKFGYWQIIRMEQIFYGKGSRLRWPGHVLKMNDQGIPKPLRTPYSEGGEGVRVVRLLNLPPFNLRDFVNRVFTQKCWPRSVSTHEIFNSTFLLENVKNCRLTMISHFASAFGGFAPRPQ